jgi:RNA polymerase sigma factor (TIGR02999 family)
MADPHNRGVGDEPRDVTALLARWQEGDRRALDDVTELVYAELRRLARGYLRNERPGHTLQPTALVAEAYLRLCAPAGERFANRAHFVAIAARNMRKVLVDHARRRDADKRGGGQLPITLDPEVFAEARPESFLAIDDAIRELEQLDPRKAQIVDLIYFGGLEQNEVAEIVEVNVKTVSRDLRLALAWIKNKLRNA